MRKELLIPIKKELQLIQLLSDRVIGEGYNASNTIVVTVSSDYSSIVGQLMRHNLSFEGEIAEGFSVDVPYPTGSWTNRFISELKIMFQMHSDKFENKTLLLTEAAIIRGGNYTFLVNWIKENYPNVKVKTLTLFENCFSIFKSDYVGKIYDNSVSDITFSWERENRNW